MWRARIIWVKCKLCSRTQEMLLVKWAIWSCHVWHLYRKLRQVNYLQTMVEPVQPIRSIIMEPIILWLVGQGLQIIILIYRIRRNFTSQAGNRDLKPQFLHVLSTINSSLVWIILIEILNSHMDSLIIKAKSVLDKFKILRTLWVKKLSQIKELLMLKWLQLDIRWEVLICYPQIVFLYLPVPMPPDIRQRKLKVINENNYYKKR